jgi:hypothetical protein
MHMAGTAIIQALEIIQQLDPDELRQVQQAVEARLKQQDEAAARASFHRALLSSGLVKEVKTMLPHVAGECPLVPIQGKPLSETVMEERR